MAMDLHGIIDRLGDYDVVLAPSYALAKEINLAAARMSPGGAFGTTATTFWSWVEGLWERHGDGRQIASDVQVSVVLSRVLSAHEGTLQNRPGLAVAALRIMQRAAGLDAFERAVTSVADRPDGLLPAECELLDCIAIVRDELSWIGLVEQGVAVAWMAHHAVLDEGGSPLRVGIVSESPLRPLEAQFFDVCCKRGALSLTRLSLEGEVLDAPTPARLTQAPATTSLRFAFPAGAYATGQLVIEMLEDLLPAGPVVLSCADPAGLYGGVAAELARRDVRVAMRGRMAWGHTALGRAWLSLYQCLSYEYLPWDRSALADVLASPLMRTDGARVWGWDAGVRGDRLLERDAVIGQLREGNRFFRLLHDLVTAPSRDTFALVEEALVTGSGLVPSELSEELDALGILRELYLVSHRLGIAPTDMARVFLPLLERASISVRRANFSRLVGLSPQVTICAQSQAAQTMPGGCASMVVLDLDSDSYPAARKDNALSILLTKLGVEEGEDFLDARRRDFSALVVAPTANLVLGRCLNDASAEPRYHCALLEEFIDLYRDDPTRVDDIDNDYALPAALQQGMYAMGEEDLVADVRPGARVPLVASGEPLSGAARVQLVSNRRAEVDPDAPLVLSPAQIEAYLSCPHKWFATRRMGASGLDEGLGFREMGSFRHDILQEFYQRFSRQGYHKISNENLEIAEATYHDAFKTTLERHLSGEASARAPFLIGTTEERLVELIDNELWRWLWKDAQTLEPYTGADGRHRRFVPAAFELEISDAQGQPVSYAGALLRGRIDRIDVDRKTKRAVVFDYKGSVGSAYDLVLDKEGVPDLTRHLQALIYAHVIEREPALRTQLGIEPCGDLPAVVGALYLSYRRGNTIRGAYVSEEIPQEALPTLVGKEAGLSAASFAKVLENLEKLVATNVVEPIRAGETSPNPSSGEACRFCPVAGCPRRR